VIVGLQLISTAVAYVAWRTLGVAKLIAAETSQAVDNPWTEAGAFSIVLVVAFWLLRRSDSREAANEARHVILEAELRTKIAELTAQVAELRVDNASLKRRVEDDNHGR